MWNGHGREEKPNECNVCGMIITERKGKMYAKYVEWPMSRGKAR